MNLRHAAVFALALIGAGCAFANPTYTQSGRAGYAVTCPSDEHQKCYAKAAQLCMEHGYDIFQQTEGSVFSITIACKGQ